MPKETIIIELDFDTSDFSKNAAGLTKSISQLNTEQKALKKSGQEGSIQFQKNSEALKSNKKELADTNKTISNLTTANKAASGSNDQLRAQLSLLTKQYNSLSKEERLNGARGKELNKQINQTTDSLKENEEAVGDNRRSVGDYGKALDGTPFGSFITGAKAMGAAFLANPIAIIILGIVGAFALLKEAFTSSEEGQNKYAKAMAILGSIFDNFIDVVADIAEFLVDMFSNPQQAIKDFAKLIKDNIVNRFMGLLELIPQLGKAITQLFSGDFAEAGKTAANAVAKVALGVEDLTGKLESAGEALSNFSKAAIKDANEAAIVADKRAKADIIERNLLVERARLETRIADLRLIAKREDSVSAADRKKALIEARDLEDGLLLKEQEALKLRFEAQKQENTFARSNKENLNKVAELEAALFRNQTARANAERTIQRELNTVNAQVRTAEKKVAKEKKKEDDEAIKLVLDNAKKELDAFLKLHQSKIDANAFLNDELFEQEKQRLEKTLEAEKIFQEQRLEQGVISQEQFNDAINQVNDENDAEIKALKDEKRTADEEQRFVDLENQREIDLLNRESEFEIAQQDLERARTQEVLAAQETGADVSLIHKKFDLQERELKRETAFANLEVASAAIGDLTNLANEGSETQKALAKTQATINGLLAITSVLAAPPSADTITDGILKGVRIATAVATTAKSISAISATKKPAKAAKGGMFGGKPHSQGGTKGVFDDGTQVEVEADEAWIVINKNSSAMIDRLSSINEAGGGVSFGGGGKLTFQDGGIGLNGVSTSVQSEAEQSTNILEAVASLPAPVVIVQDINEVQQTTNIVEARAEV